MQIKKVALLGAGAVGSYIIWGLSKKTEIQLCVVAEGERKSALETEGIWINDEKYDVPVCTPEEAAGADLLIVTVKYGALEGIQDMIRRIVRENTVVMSLMNGVDSEEIIAQTIGEEPIVYSLIKVASHRIGRKVYFDPETTIGIIYGEKNAPYDSERIGAVTELFENTGIHYRATDEILAEMWGKFRLNITNNLPQAILGAGVGCYNDSEHMQFIHRKLKEEVEMIACAKGIDLNKIKASSTKGSPVAPSARYSTLQDLDNHRHTEIDMFSGAIIRMGRQLGIATPYNEYTYHIIKALEEKNDGLFDYQNRNVKSTAAG